MFPNNIEFMASEHRRDLEQEAEQMRLIKAAGLQQPNYREMAQNAANWLGNHLIKWGSRLQHHGSLRLPQITSTEVASIEYPQT